MIEAMVDNETWGIRVTSVVRSVGIVVFDGPLVLEKHYFRISESDQDFERLNLETGHVMPARTRDESTVKWWALPENATAQATIAEAPYMHWEQAREECLRIGSLAQNVWSKPGMFDLPMLRDLFGQDIWPYWKERCLSTLLGEFDPQRTTKPPFDGVPHNALDDALHAHRWLIALREHIRGLAAGRGEKFVRHDGRRGYLISSDPHDGALLIFHETDRSDGEIYHFFTAERDDVLPARD